MRADSVRRVVITGIGLVTPLAVGVRQSWARLIAGDSGIVRLTEEDYAELPCRVGGRVPRGPHPDQWNDKLLNASEHRSMSLASQYGLIAAKEALWMADWWPSEEKDQLRTGVCVGSAMPGFQDIADAVRLLDKGMYRKITPYCVPRILTNMTAGNISLKYSLRGPNHTVSTACATGLHSLGDAAQMIRYGQADVMVAGGAEATVTPLAVAGFLRARALSTKFNDEPSQASRPFDEKRDGFVLSEGAGVMVLEEHCHAVDRGTPVLGEVLGYGMSGDPNHITAPSKDGRGAVASMTSALSDGNVDPKQICFISAHATSTPLGDAAETNAIKQVFGEHASSVAITACKGSIGHLQGAAGAVEAIFALQAMRMGILPPNRNLFSANNQNQLNFVPQKAQQLSPSTSRIALINSFGFGGTSASLCIRGNQA